MSVFTCNAVRLPSLAPVMDFLVVELSEIEIVLESLVDCVCFADMIKSLISLISFLHVMQPIPGFSLENPYCRRSCL